MDTMNFAAPPDSVQPDLPAALKYFEALLPDQGTICCRAVSDKKDGRPATNHHLILGDTFATQLSDFLDYCHSEQRAAYVIPGYVNPGGTRASDVVALTSVLADFDAGDAAAKLSAAEALIGPANIVCESGGRTEYGPRLHAY